ncbi:MAG TPA: hypothetical protein VGV92_07725 [Gammaproteobacteria bacterium]|nr:hypothetical protein [Gammaproteobacteria bacterium]
MKALRGLWFTIISIILTYYVAVLAHEYGHGTMAWIFGYKTSPFDIQYGSWYLVPVDEAVNYPALLSAGHGVQAGLIGIAGITTTFLLFLMSLFSLSKSVIQKNSFLLSFFFWLAAINLMEMFSYLNRSFLMDGDMGRFVHGLNISPLWVFIPGSIIVCLSLYRFYKVEIIKLFKFLPIQTKIMQRIVLWLTFWQLPLSVMFYWAGSGAVDPGWSLVSNTAHGISLAIIIFILIICHSGYRIFYGSPENYLDKD